MFGRVCHGAWTLVDLVFATTPALSGDELDPDDFRRIMAPSTSR